MTESIFGSDYDTLKTGGGVMIPNGDYIFKVTSYDAAKIGKAGGRKHVSVGLEAISNTDGEPVTFATRLVFWIYADPNKSVEKQAISRNINLGRLKSFMCNITRKALTEQECTALVLSDGGELLSELIGGRIARVKQFKDPTRSQVEFDRFFMAEPKDKRYVTFDDKPIGEYSDLMLSKSIRENLFTGTTTPKAVPNSAKFGGLDDDEIPF